MSGTSQSRRILAAITRIISALVAVAALAIGAVCAVCFVPGPQSHRCCHPSPEDYLLVEAAASMGCPGDFASIATAIGYSKDDVLRSVAALPLTMLRATPPMQESPGRLHALSDPAIGAPSYLNAHALLI